MTYPGLAHEDHKVLGSDFCSGYIDVYGKWENGFYCPQTSPTSTVFCCGIHYYKYCCITKPPTVGISANNGEDDQSSFASPDSLRIPLLLAIFCGVLAVVTFLVTIICFFCSCCVVYKKRRERETYHAPFSDLYHIEGSSSAASALTSLYSNPNSFTSTPLGVDSTDWSAFPPTGGAANGGGSYIPYPFPNNSSLLNSHYSVPFSGTNLSRLSSAYSSTLTMTSSQQPQINRGNGFNYNSSYRTLNNSNTLPPPYYYNNLNQREQLGERNVSNSLSNMYRQYHQTVGQSARSSDFHQQTPCGLYHVTNLPIRSQSRVTVGPPPAYTARQTLTPTAAANRVVELEMQQSQSNRNNQTQQQQQQQTCFANQPDVNCNQNNFNGSGRHLQRGNTSGIQREASRGEQNLSPQSLATITSLINAYRVPPQPPNAPLSLTTADVNRLNAINLLVSTLLNQNQNSSRQTNNTQQGRRRGESGTSNIPQVLSSSPSIISSASAASGSTTSSEIGSSVSNQCERRKDANNDLKKQVVYEYQEENEVNANEDEEVKVLLCNNPPPSSADQFVGNEQEQREMVTNVAEKKHFDDNYVKDSESSNEILGNSSSSEEGKNCNMITCSDEDEVECEKKKSNLNEETCVISEKGEDGEIENGEQLETEPVGVKVMGETISN